MSLVRHRYALRASGELYLAPAVGTLADFAAWKRGALASAVIRNRLAGERRRDVVERFARAFAPGFPPPAGPKPPKRRPAARLATPGRKTPGIFLRYS